MRSFPIRQVAYSVPDSFLTLRWMARGQFSWEMGELPEGLYLRIVHGIGRPLCFRLVPMKGGRLCEVEEYTVSLTAGGVVIRIGADWLALTFERPDVLSIAGSGLGLRFDLPPEKFEYVAPYSPVRCLVNTYASRAQFMLEAQRGTMAVDAPYETKCCRYIHCDFQPDGSGHLQLTCDHFEKTWRASPRLADARRSMAENQARFDAFRAGFSGIDPTDETAELALFVLWSAVIPPHNLVKRRGVLMSNNWMLNVWTWDSALNAMGLSLGDPALAVDQLMFPYDNQAENGLLPDCVNPYAVVWNFTKPPVHGLAYVYFLRSVMTEAQVEPLYDGMAAQLDYWLREADSDGDGIPQYNHGNDCGWDNCTPFEVGAPVEGPDLSAYLALCMEAMADMALRLNRPGESAAWREKSKSMIARLIEHSWDGKRFRVYQSGTHRVSPRGDSLYPYLPLVLGHRLPADVFQTMAAQLKLERFLLTPYGLATESTASPCYEADGYWRGPIWAPPMLFIIMGLHDGGDEAFARDLALRFLRLCRRSGMAENFNALTGEGLRDPAYTWTASTYLILASRYGLAQSDPIA